MKKKLKTTRKRKEGEGKKARGRCNESSCEDDKKVGRNFVDYEEKGENLFHLPSIEGKKKLAKKKETSISQDFKEYFVNTKKHNQ